MWPKNSPLRAATPPWAHLGEAVPRHRVSQDRWGRRANKTPKSFDFGGRPILKLQSQIPNLNSSISNLQSAIPNPQSTIPNPQSQTNAPPGLRPPSPFMENENGEGSTQVVSSSPECGPPSHSPASTPFLGPFGGGVRSPGGPTDRGGVLRASSLRIKNLRSIRFGGFHITILWE